MKKIITNTLVKKFIKHQQKEEFLITQDYIDVILEHLKIRNELHLLFIFEFTQNTGLDYFDTHYSDIDFNKAPLSRRLLVEHFGQQNESTDGLNQDVLMQELQYNYENETLGSVFSLNRPHLKDYM